MQAFLAAPDYNLANLSRLSRGTVAYGDAGNGRKCHGNTLRGPCSSKVGIDSRHLKLGPDEFPYASTVQAGMNGPAIGEVVPKDEQLIQADMLQGVYTGMRNQPGVFLVVPVPI